jgi:hypothetical protein
MDQRMTGDDATGQEPRDVIINVLEVMDVKRHKSKDTHRYYADSILNSLSRAGYSITPRRSEPVVEISVEDACNFEGAMSKNWDVDYTALHRLREALARATGDETERYG